MIERAKIASRMPGWVKVFIGLGVLAVVAVSFVMFAGHGPWQHGGAPAAARDHTVMSGNHG